MEYSELQALIDSGAAWKLEGSVGRAAMEAIEEGHCILGPEGHYDTYGGYVPSRDEVKPGTPGSVEYRDEKVQELAKNVLGIDLHIYRF
jgi:hypothetical protein